MATEHRFTGQKQDGTGLMYYGARYYDPAIGAFISPDTIVPDATNVFAYNRYMYSVGNPLGYSDPNGHEPCPTGAWGDCSPTPSRGFVNNLATSRHQAGSDWEDLSAEMQTADEWLLISDVDFDQFSEEVNAEDLYRQFIHMLKCPTCQRLHIFWNGFSHPQEVYIADDTDH